MWVFPGVPRRGQWLPSSHLTGCTPSLQGGSGHPPQPSPALLLHTSTILDHMLSARNLFMWCLWQKPSSSGSAVTSLWRKLERTSLLSDSVPSTPSSTSITSPAPWSSELMELFVQSSNRHKWAPHLCWSPDSQSVCPMKGSKLGRSQRFLQMSFLLISPQQVIEGLSVAFLLAFCLNWPLRHLAAQFSPDQPNSWQLKKRLKKVGVAKGK